MSNDQVLKVKCPTCRKSIEYSTQNPFRPFCCERCRLIDLGAWADEAYKVPTQEFFFSDQADEERNKNDEE